MSEPNDQADWGDTPERRATNAAISAMELAVADMPFLPSLGEAAQVSLAISLKRIADAVAPMNGQSIGDTLFYIEQRLGPQS